MSERTGVLLNSFKTEDLYYISKRKLLGLNNYKLQTVAEHLAIDYCNVHRAIDDCMIIKKVYDKLNQLWFTN